MQPFWNQSSLVPSASPNMRASLISHYPVGTLGGISDASRSEQIHPGLVLPEWKCIASSSYMFPSHHLPTRTTCISSIFWGILRAFNSSPQFCMVLLLIPTLSLFCLFPTLYIAGSQWVFFGIAPRLIQCIFLYPSQGGLGTKCRETLLLCPSLLTAILLVVVLCC